ncbi:MAG: hypothetical protein KDA65_02470 [Planctomycetaceae bacterium]|nr:hypothetical protein [Planctomycetaceae bacterium]
MPSEATGTNKKTRACLRLLVGFFLSFLLVLAIRCLYFGKVVAVNENVEIVLTVENDDDVPMIFEPNKTEHNAFLKRYGIKWETKNKHRSFSFSVGNRYSVTSEYSWYLVDSDGTYDYYIFNATINGKKIATDKKIKYSGNRVIIGTTGRFGLVLAPEPTFDD